MEATRSNSPSRDDRNDKLSALRLDWEHNQSREMVINRLHQPAASSAVDSFIDRASSAGASADVASLIGGAFQSQRGVHNAPAASGGPIQRLDPPAAPDSLRYSSGHAAIASPSVPCTEIATVTALRQQLPEASPSSPRDAGTDYTGNHGWMALQPQATSCFGDQHKIPVAPAGALRVPPNTPASDVSTALNERLPGEGFSNAIAIHGCRYQQQLPVLLSASATAAQFPARSTARKTPDTRQISSGDVNGPREGRGLAASLQVASRPTEISSEAPPSRPIVAAEAQQGADIANARGASQQKLPNWLLWQRRHRRPYRDHADDPPVRENIVRAAASRVCTTPNGTSAPFPLLLHNMLENADLHGYSNICGWQPHGRAFSVHDPEKFVQLIMPLYFSRQSRFASFQRQLSLYGFVRMSKEGPDYKAYYHELCLRGRPDLCCRMQRTGVRAPGTRQQDQHSDLPRQRADPNAEPNFYAMKPVFSAEVSAVLATAASLSAARGSTIAGATIDQSFAGAAGNIPSLTSIASALPPVFKSPSPLQLPPASAMQDATDRGKPQRQPHPMILPIVPTILPLRQDRGADLLSGGDSAKKPPAADGTVIRRPNDCSAGTHQRSSDISSIPLSAIQFAPAGLVSEIRSSVASQTAGESTGNVLPVGAGQAEATFGGGFMTASHSKEESVSSATPRTSSNTEATHDRHVVHQFLASHMPQLLSTPASQDILPGHLGNNHQATDMQQHDSATASASSTNSTPAPPLLSWSSRRTLSEPTVTSIGATTALSESSSSSLPLAGQSGARQVYATAPPATVFDSTLSAPTTTGAGLEDGSFPTVNLQPLLQQQQQIRLGTFLSRSEEADMVTFLSDVDLSEKTGHGA